MQRARSKSDARRAHLALTARGRKAFAPLDARSRDDVAALLGRLPAAQQQRLVDALKTVEELLVTWAGCSSPTS